MGASSVSTNNEFKLSFQAIKKEKGSFIEREVVRKYWIQKKNNNNEEKKFTQKNKVKNYDRPNNG